MVTVYADEVGFLVGAESEDELRERVQLFAQEVARCDEEGLPVRLSESLWQTPIFQGKKLDSLLDGSFPGGPLDPDLRRTLLFSLNFKQSSSAPGPPPPGLALAIEATSQGISVAYLAKKSPEPPPAGVTVVSDLVSRARMYCKLEGHEQARRCFFEHLLRSWRQEAFGYSVLQRLYAKDSYQALIALGERIVPWLLRELQERPFHWTYALSQITGAQPVQPENKGHLAAMTRDWLQWGRQQGLSW